MRNSQSTPARQLPRKLRRIGVAVIAILLVAIAGWYWNAHKAQAAAGGYRTVTVECGDLRVAISATGTLSAISTVTIGSQVSGQVTDVLVDFNDKVKKDQILARIDPSTYEAQIAQGSAQISGAQASLRQAQAALKNADIDFQRKAGLGKQQLVALSDVDLARAARDQALAQVSSAQAQIRQQTASTETTRIDLDRTVIRSPVDGVVLTRTIEPGQTVAASLQAPELFTIAEDLGKMKIELAVDEADIGQVKTGQTVSFTADAFPNRQFKGVVEQVRLSATTTNNVVTYPVVVTVDNSDGTLLPGLTVNAEIEVSKRDNVLQVSNAALRYKPAASDAQASAQPTAATRGGGSGSGVTDDLARTVAAMEVDAQQQAAFDAAVAAIGKRQAARQAAPRTETGSTAFGAGGPRRSSGGTGPSAGTQGQTRQRMLERYQQDFAAFRTSLDEAQRRQLDAAIQALASATRAPLYKLVEGTPQMVMVRIGFSDGTNTEVSGDIKVGDQIVTGEPPAQ